MNTPIIEKTRKFINPTEISIDDRKIKVNKRKNLKMINKNNNKKLDRKTYEAEKCKKKL